MVQINPKTFFYLIIAFFVIISSLSFIFLYNPSLSGLVIMKPSFEAGIGSYNNTFYNQSGFVQLSSGISGSYKSAVFDANVTTAWKSLDLVIDVPSATLIHQIKPSSAYYTDKDKTNEALSSSQMAKINKSDNSRFSFESRDSVDANLTLVWNANIPAGAQITSAVLVYGHQESEDENVAVKGSVLSNGASVDVCTFSVSKNSDVTDTCDLSSYLSTPAAANNLNFMITFTRDGSSKSEKADFVALNVTYTLDTAMQLFVHSCDDGLCNGEEWHAYTNAAQLTENDARYFQYIAYFYSDSTELTPKLYNATITFNTAPSVQFNFPLNDEVISINSTLLNATLFDNNLDDITVWFYSDDILVTLVHNVSNGTTLTYNVSSLVDGQHNWTVIANDGTVNSTAIYKYFNISVPNLNPTQPDITKPSIEIISPAHKKYADKDISFRYSVNDDSNITNCSLILNGELNQTAQDVVKNSTQEFTVSLSAGKYRWQIACTDSANNANISESRRLFVVSLTNFDGSTTDITTLNSEVISGLVLEKALYGKINFSEEINLSDGADIDVNVNISAGRVEINSSALPQLNKSAVITLYNISYSNPRVIKDGAVCPETICQVLSYSNGTLKINLSGFSVYTIEETPSSPSAPIPSGSSSSGGGCLAKWNCTVWNECAEGKQTRVCTKVPEYCYGGTKPSEEQKCNTTELATKPIILGETGEVVTEREQNVPKQKEEIKPKTIGVGAFIAELPLKIKLALLGNISSLIVLALIVFRFFIPVLKKEGL